MRHALLTATALFASILVAACQHQSPIEPSQSGTVEQLVMALRQQGLRVSLGGVMPPETHRIFSVSAQQLLVNDPPVNPFEAHVNVFEYPSAEAAAREAALVSADGQLRPNAMITWVSTPRFYRHNQLIVLYVGCAPEIIQALQATIGRPFVTGTTPCRAGM